MAVMRPQQYAKAIIGAVVAALTALAGYLVPGSKAAAAVTIALAFLAALGAVFMTPNATPAAPAATPTPNQQAVPYPQDVDKQAKMNRLDHATTSGGIDLNVFRSDLKTQARRLAANAERVRQGLPPWNFALARAVPPTGTPPVG